MRNRKTSVDYVVIETNSLIIYYAKVANVVQSLSSLEMDTVTQVQILDETDCISHSTNTLGKGMNPIIPPPAMGK